MQDTIVNGQPRSSRQGKMMTRDGGSIPIRANYMALRSEKGTIVGGLTTFHDLTLVQQLKQAMAVLDQTLAAEKSKRDELEGRLRQQQTHKQHF